MGLVDMEHYLTNERIKMVGPSPEKGKKIKIVLDPNSEIEKALDQSRSQMIVEIAISQGKTESQLP